jgi:cytochrome c biogenesis protein CcdA
MTESEGVNGVVSQLVAAGKELCAAIGEKAEAAYAPTQTIIMALFNSYVEDAKAEIKHKSAVATTLFFVSGFAAAALGGGIIAVIYGGYASGQGPHPALVIGVGVVAIGVLATIRTFAAAMTAVFDAMELRGRITRDAVGHIVDQIRTVRRG